MCCVSGPIARPKTYVKRRAPEFPILNLVYFSFGFGASSGVVQT